MTEKDIEMDLSADEQPEEADKPDLQTPDPEERETDDEVDIEAKGHQQAKRFLQSSEGQAENERERAQKALEQAHETYQSHHQQRQQTAQQAAESERKVAQFEKTVERIEEMPDDVPVFQSLAGGVTVGIPPESDDGKDRADLIEDLEEAAEAAEENAERYRERAESMATEAEIIEEAISNLESHREMFDEA